MLKLFFKIVVLTCSTHLLVQCKYFIKSEEENLFTYLFKNYNPSARPVINSSDSVVVRIQFSLLQIQDLNVRNQILTSTGLLILEWKDERLSWKKDISTLDEVVVHGDKIWRPEFAVINGAEGIYGEYKEFQATLRSDGSIRWEPGGVFKTMCGINITYYPFDCQRCMIKFGSWSYYTNKMNLTTDSRKITLDSYESNGEWEIESTAVKRDEFFFEATPHQRFSFVEFYVDLRRRHMFYVMNVILPGILTSAVLLSIFYCVPSQKVHIGVAALLSFRLFLVNVADTIPKTSDHVPLLGVYLTCTMAITTLAMVATVLVGNLHERKDGPVPGWVRTVFMGHLATVLLIGDNKAFKKDDDAYMEEEEKLLSNNGTGETKFEGIRLMNLFKRRSRKGGIREKSPIRNPNGFNNQQHQQQQHQQQQHQQQQHQHHHARTNRTKSYDYSSSSSTTTSRHATPRRKDDTPPNNADQRQTGQQTNYAKDWANIAAVCDRFFFWTCLVFIVATTLVLFHPLTPARNFI